MGIEIGQTIGHYRILKFIGWGCTTGTRVYHAENTRLGCEVVLRFPDSDETIQLLEHEAHAAAGLMHPDIVHVYFEGVDGYSFQVHECVESDTLADRIQRGSFPIDETLRIGKALAAGLAHAHSKGVFTATSTRRTSL